MNEPRIRFPVTCPICGNEQLEEHPVANVAAALLTRAEPLQLDMRCHDQRWSAREYELEQIRDYLAALLHTHADELHG